MSHDKVMLNGMLTDTGGMNLGSGFLPGDDFVYHRIHCLAHKPLYPGTISQIASSSFMSLYGTETGLDTPTLEQEVRELLRENRYPDSSTEVILYLFPGKEGCQPQRMIVCVRQLLYKGLVMWHSGLSGVTRPYDYPFGEHLTSTSLAAHNYASRYVKTKGYEIAVRENYSGELASAGEYPLFALIGRSIYTPPLSKGGTDSVHRRLGLASAGAAGYTTIETPLSSEIAENAEEYLFVNTQGIVSLVLLDGRMYPNSGARKIAEYLNKI